MTTVNNIYGASSASAQVTQLTPIPPAGTNSGLSFGDVLDAVNPLQHIPVVSGLYRAATGGSISTTSQLAGDTIYGAFAGGASAAMGFASSLANVVVKQISGQDIGQHVVATINAASSSISASTTPTATQLTPDSAAVSSAIAAQATLHDTSVATQVAQAAQTILHSGARPELANGRYMRVQALDAVNKQLTKIVV